MSDDRDFRSFAAARYAAPGEEARGEKKTTVMAPHNPDISVKENCMTPAAPSLRLRPNANNRVARAALYSRLQIQGASHRAAHIRAGRVLFMAGLLGCGLHLTPSAQAAPTPLAQGKSASGANHSAGISRRPRLNAFGKAMFQPRASMPKLSIAALPNMPKLSLGGIQLASLAIAAPIEVPAIVTQSSAKQMRLSHRFFAQNTPPRANVMPTEAPQFPAARFPAFADSTFAGIQDLPDLIAPATIPAAPVQHASKRVQVVSNVGGGKMIQFQSSAQLGTAGTAKNNVSVVGTATPPSVTMPAPIPAAPSMPTLPLAADASGLSGGMKKVIKVPGLALPPLSQPLPDWMKAASVRVDRLDKSSKPIPAPAPATANGQRLAQNPDGSPVRQPAAPVTSSDRLSNQIEVATSTFVVLLTTTDLQTVAVADPTIADVAVVNSRSVLLNGKAPGVTSLVIVDGQKIRQYSVRVTQAPGSRPIDVTAAIGIPGVSVRPVKDSLVLEGEVGSADEAKRAEEIASVYAPKVINQLSVRSTGGSPADASMAQMSEMLADYPSVKARLAGETVILSGEVADPRDIQDAETIASATGKKVVNLIKLPVLTVDQLRQSLGATDTLTTQSMPGQISTVAPISVRELGGQLVLEGYSNSQADIDLALAAAKRTGLPIVNHLAVRPALSTEQQLTSAVAAAIGRPNITVRGTTKRLVLEGTVNDTNEAVLAEQVARGFAGSVDNLLQTPSPVQVSVDVTIAEINSTDARALGVQYGTASLTNETIGTAPVVGADGTPVIGTDGLPLTQKTVSRTINPSFTQGVAQAGNGFAGFGGLGFIDPFRARINALVNNNRGRILSAPSTTVLSGRTATFQVGGQVPIPAVSTIGNNGNTTAIVFKNYGILLDVVPNALPSGVVTLRVRTEVSQPDFANGVTPPGGGGVVPGFQTRSTVTEVTVPPSGILSLSGLIRSEDTKAETGVPILSKIPIIGSLFKSKDFRQNKTELVIFVKPRVLANPLTDGQLAPAGVVAVGENSNAATQLGNSGISSFNGGSSISTAPSGGGAAQ
ncbi:BON domain-containing protein [bacterium]|nr:MAG: BON domain-containing protein [bacterium]